MNLVDKVDHATSISSLSSSLLYDGQRVRFLFRDGLHLVRDHREVEEAELWRGRGLSWSGVALGGQLMGLEGVFLARRREVRRGLAVARGQGGSGGHVLVGAARGVEAEPVLAEVIG